MFDSVIQVGNKDISDEKRMKYLRTQWFKHSTADVQDVKTMFGWGKQITLQPEVLLTTGNVNTEVGVDLYALGTYKAVIGYDSYQMVNGKLVGVGEPKVVIDDTTGDVVVMNGDDEDEE